MTGRNQGSVSRLGASPSAMPARRAPAEFSLSFLDVICCGFGAVILLLMITKTVQPQVIEQAMVDAESAVAELTEQLSVLQPLAWYAGKAFHFGFIPLVIVLGMRTEPRPKLVDLLTPM